jgi:hypothetical protein
MNIEQRNLGISTPPFDLEDENFFSKIGYNGSNYPEIIYVTKVADFDSPQNKKLFCIREFY